MKKKKKQLSKTISTTGGTKNNMHLRTKKPKSVTMAMVTKTAKTTTTTQPRKKRTTYMTKLTPHQIKQQQDGFNMICDAIYNRSQITAV